MAYHPVLPPVITQRTAFSFPEQTFDFLETPEYYFDGFHLNAKGRQRFTETLVAELVGHLRSANSDGRVRSESRVAAGRLSTGDGLNHRREIGRASCKERV